MAAPAQAPVPIPRRVFYGAFHPLILHPDEDVRALTKGHAIDMRADSRILNLARDCHHQIKRWISEVNARGEAQQYINGAFAQLAGPERAGFVPGDRLYLEADRPEQVFNPDAQSAGKLEAGAVFFAVTDFRECVVNFDLRPFLEAYVRRLSGAVPDYVWRINDRFYIRTHGFAFKEEPTPRFEPRRFAVPKQVVEGFGFMPPVPFLKCIVCGKEDDRVALQPDPKRPQAHATCL